MKHFLLLIVLLLIIVSCHIRSTTYEDPTRTWLHVIFDGSVIYEEYLDDADDNQTVNLNLPDSSEISLSKFVNTTYADLDGDGNLDISRHFIAWSKKTGYFTQYTSGTYLDTLLINASSGFTPVIPDRVCGTVYYTTHSPVTNRTFYILQDSVFVDSFMTSANGYFDVDIPLGIYELSMNGDLYPCELYEVVVDSFYDDYAIIQPLPILPKPVIYLYPEEEMELSVHLEFPNGGYLTVSIPEYGAGWENLKIDTSGKINDEYNYLFYESQNPELFQHRKGWIVSQEKMEAFFIQNLAETGFEGQEIIDFVDYWFPRFTGYSHYAIYPQYKEQLDKMVELDISIEPDNIMRLFYVVEGRDNDNTKLIEPEIPEFEREGFFVVEWGARIRSQIKLSINK